MRLKWAFLIAVFDRERYQTRPQAPLKQTIVWQDPNILGSYYSSGHI